MPLSDDELADALRGFARRFAESCTFQTAENLLRSGEHSIEYHNEPSDDRYFEVEASALDRGSDERGEYIMLMCCANDLRSKLQLGSTWRPMCCQLFIYANGVHDFGPIGNSAASGEIRDF